MKKICVFTQTYSNNRLELFHYHNKDMSDIYFRNNFNLNFYSFHNSNIDYTNQLLNFEYFKNLHNLKVINYDNISYTESFKMTLKYLVDNGFDYLIFLQDDCLTYSDITKELVDFIKNEEFDMLNLENTPTHLNISNPKVLYSINNFEVYETYSSDFSKNGLYSFDDGAYVGKIDFLMKNLYDDKYFNESDIWRAEGHLSCKIGKSPIQRLTTNIKFYNRYNLIGPNSNRKDTIDFLQKRFIV